MSSQHQAYGENQEEINDEQDNENLLDDIDELGNRTDYRKENVILCGKGGSGKSSLINALRKAFAGKYTNKAKCGKGASFSKTLALERYYNYFQIFVCENFVLQYIIATKEVFQRKEL